MSLVDTRTVEEEILYSHPDIERQRARNICGAMMFSGDDALKKISVLSGGEKSRVMLGKLLATPVNLLLLDEPTNHLDMESCDALLAAIDLFEGTVIMVTHNEMFLHTLAERLVVFQNDQIETFDGRYQEFLERGGWHDENSAIPNGRPEVTFKDAAAKQTKKEMRRKRSEIINQKSKTVKPLEKRITGIENKIEAREIELDHLNHSMQQASEDQDGARIAELSRSIHACQTAIDELFDELETISNELDTQNAEFNRALRELDDVRG
jgi:ATP-binding cassette subfamily F protein 3